MLGHTTMVIQEMINTQAALLSVVKRLIEHERDKTRFVEPDTVIRALEDQETRMKALLD